MYYPSTVVHVYGSYLACGGNPCQSLVAVKTAIFSMPEVIFFTAAGDVRFCFCVAGAAFQGLLACSGTHACLFLIACGGKKSIACGGMWVSLMPGYTKPIACGSTLLRLMHSRMQILWGRKRHCARAKLWCFSRDFAAVVANMTSVVPWACCSCTYCGSDSDGARVLVH